MTDVWDMVMSESLQMGASMSSEGLGMERFDLVILLINFWGIEVGSRTKYLPM